MSIAVMTYIWANSKHKGSALLLLLAIGDHAHDDGAGAYPAVETLANKVRMTVRNTQLLLRKLTESGELLIEPRAGPHGANIYTIPLQATSPLKTLQGEIQGSGGEILGSLGVKPASPKSSSESSLNHHIILPDWVNKTLWESFLEMRKKARATPTLHAQSLLITALTRLKEAGNSPDAVLEQSIMNSWKGLFAIKQNDGAQSQDRIPDKKQRIIYDPDLPGGKRFVYD